MPAGHEAPSWSAVSFVPKGRRSPARPAPVTHSHRGRANASLLPDGCRRVPATARSHVSARRVLKSYARDCPVGPADRQRRVPGIPHIAGPSAGACRCSLSRKGGVRRRPALASQAAHEQHSRSGSRGLLHGPGSGSAAACWVQGRRRPSKQRQVRSTTTARAWRCEHVRAQAERTDARAQLRHSGASLLHRSGRRSSR